MTDENLKNTPQDAAKGYWIVLATVLDNEGFGNYTFVAGPVIKSFGGRVLARGDVAIVVEGAVSGRPYVIEFPSYHAAQACFGSAPYQAAIALRDGVAEFNIIIAQGFVPPEPAAPNR